MMYTKKLNLYLLFFVFLPLATLAQRKGEIDQEELSRANTLLDEYEDVTAVSLMSKQRVVFDYNEAIQHVFVTSKLEEQFLGLAPGSFYKTQFYNDQTKISEVEITYKGGKKVPATSISPKFENYKQSGIFHSDAKVCYIKMPFYKGYRYHVNLTKRIDDIKYLTAIYFHESYPIRKKIIEFVVPKWMKVELKEMNFEGYEIQKEARFDVGLNANIHTYTLELLPKMAKENKSQGPSHIYPHILVLSKSFEKAGKTTKLFESVDDLYAWYKSLVDEMENDQTDIAEKVKEITKDATTDKEKVSAIYYWVQDNIRYIAFEDGIAGFKPDACQNVYNKKYGDCKGMANLTKEMLKIAGYDARLVWMGTRRLAYDYSIPSLAVDNHMICAVFLDDEVYYLDPTEKYGAFGEYAERIQGRPVLIEDGENYLLKEIPKATLEGNATKTTMSVELNNDDLAGKITHIYKGESKSSLLYGLNSIENDRKEDALKYYLNSGDNNYKIDQLNMPDLELRDGDIELAYDITLKNKTSSFDNDIYIELDAFKEFEQFKMEDDRKNDYQFSYKILIDTEIELTIPEGYAVTYLPEKLLIDKDHYNFSLQYEKKNGKLIYKKKLALKNTVLPKQEFKTWNENIKQLKAFYAEQVTLTKQ